MKKIFVVILAFLACLPAMAQNKVAYFDIAYVLPLMPETKKAETDIQAYAKQLEAEFTKNQKEFEFKYKDFAEAAKNPEGISQTILAAKQEELQSLQKQLQDFEQRINSDVQAKRDKMLVPIYDKIDATVKEVAKANAYTHVMNAESCYLPVKSSDISELVLKKLGITPPPPAPEKK